MPLRQVAMVAIQVRDFDAQVKWYTEVLGFVVDAFEEGEFCTLALPDGGAQLAIACDHPEQLEDRSGTRWRPNVFVDDLDETLRRLEAMRVEIVAGIEGDDEGYRLVVIADPEGNPLGLFTYG